MLIVRRIGAPTGTKCEAVKKEDDGACTQNFLQSLSGQIPKAGRGQNPDATRCRRV